MVLTLSSVMYQLLIDVIDPYFCYVAATYSCYWPFLLLRSCYLL